jgi:hypothetical protein
MAATLSNSGKYVEKRGLATATELQNVVFGRIQKGQLC